jgi:transposase
MTSYVGLDVSLADTSVYVLDEGGRVRFEGRLPSRPDALFRCLRQHAADAQRVGLETGRTAGVLFRALTTAGPPALSLETRHTHRVLSVRRNKTDRNDARGLRSTGSDNPQLLFDPPMPTPLNSSDDPNRHTRPRP